MSTTEQIRELELQILLNEMLPADRQHADAIARMKERLNRLRKKATA
jgi:hypothetical protein